MAFLLNHYTVNTVELSVLFVIFLLMLMLMLIDNRRLRERNRKLENALHENSLRLKLALDAAGIAIHEWDIQTNQLIWDERLYEFWGLPSNTALSEELFLQGVHPDDRERVQSDIPELLKKNGNKKRSIQYRVIGIHTEIERWLELHGQMHFDDENLPVRFLGAAMDITEHKKTEEALRRSEQRYQQLAHIDTLTGITNRRRWFELTMIEMERAKRYGCALSIVILDVDHFKQINDSYGHPVGDKILQELVRCCSSNLRDTDLIGRYGGEEFILLLPETTLSDAYIFAERLRQTIAKQLIPITKQKSLSITVSMGGATLNNDILSLETLIELADKALYQAKKNGRNQVCTISH